MRSASSHALSVMQAIPLPKRKRARSEPTEEEAGAFGSGESDGDEDGATGVVTTVKEFAVPGKLDENAAKSSFASHVGGDGSGKKSNSTPSGAAANAASVNKASRGSQIARLVARRRAAEAAGGTDGDDAAAFRADLDRCADEGDVQTYKDVPVMSFARAMLEGMGWNGDRTKRETKQPKPRPPRLGLGAKPITSQDASNVPKSGKQGTERKELRDSSRRRHSGVDGEVAKAGVDETGRAKDSDERHNHSKRRHEEVDYEVRERDRSRERRKRDRSPGRGREGYDIDDREHDLHHERGRERKRSLRDEKPSRRDYERARERKWYRDERDAESFDDDERPSRRESSRREGERYPERRRHYSPFRTRERSRSRDRNRSRHRAGSRERGRDSSLWHQRDSRRDSHY